VTVKFISQLHYFVSTAWHWRYS